MRTQFGDPDPLEEAGGSSFPCSSGKALYSEVLKRTPKLSEYVKTGKSALKGSFNQADARFGDSRNRQCGAISLTVVLKSKIKNVLTWTTQDLDGVLVSGTHLYESLRNQGNISDREVMGRNYIAVHELPRRHVLDNTTFYIEYTESLTGFVNVNEHSEYDEAISGHAT
ncbi:hypothetical protein QQF64_012031 [Cirrhinus molitorella]|uniref:Uncharacterized protein n=1 Tax=Cirrhinus molitorella TaxID=172907 RepID=A0ABR3LWP3_9TELE